MSIEMIKAGFAPIVPVTPAQPAQGTSGITAGEGAKGTSFKDMFNEAIGEVDKLQKDANSSIENLMLGKPGASTHDTMIALEKADTAFQLMNAIRSKIVRAYEEVIRTQV